MQVRERLAVGICIATLAGCSTAEPDAPTPTLPSSPSSTPTPSPSPAERTPTDLSDPELGIVFVDIPDLTGPAASAHDAAAVFEVEFWRSVTSGTASTALAPLVSPALLDKVDSAVRLNNQNGYGFDGTKRVTIVDVTVDGSEATADDLHGLRRGGVHQLDGSPSLN